MITVKRLGNVYSKIYDIENLRLAHKKARRGKTWYKDVIMVDSDPDKYLYQLQDMLKNKTYKTSNYQHFEITDKGKKRIISKLPYYPDRICQWAIMLQIEKVFVNHFIYDTYASIPTKGIHLAQGRIKRALAKDPDGTKYCLQFDIKQYFPNIDHMLLKQLLRKKFKDKDLLWLIDEIIDSVDDGLPIGNYLSQYMANYYLSWFDHWAKEDLQLRYYYRYMDDIVILGKNKRSLHRLKLMMEEYLKIELNLAMKGNWQIYNVSIRGIDFAGYRLFRGYVLLRKRIAKNIKSKVRSIMKGPTQEADVNSIMSYCGWLCYCNGHNFVVKHILPAIRRLKSDGYIRVSWSR